MGRPVFGPSQLGATASRLWLGHGALRSAFLVHCAVRGSSSVEVKLLLAQVVVNHPKV